MTQEQSEIKKAKIAFEACQRLRELLNEWDSRVRKAVKSGKMPDETINKLLDFIVQTKFDARVGEQAGLLRPEPLCKDLIEKTGAFNRTAYVRDAVSGGVIKIAFEHMFLRRDYTKDDAKDDALRFFKDKVKDFEDELNKIIPLLQEKAE